MSLLCALRRDISSQFFKCVTSVGSVRYAGSAVTGGNATRPGEERLKSIDSLPTVGFPGLPLFINKLISTALALKSDVSKGHELNLINSIKYGRIYRNSMMVFDMVVLSDPKLIEKFVRFEDKYPMRLQFVPWIEYRKESEKPLGILLEDGERWQRARSAMSKRLMRPKEIGLFMNSMNEVANDVLERLKKLRPTEGPNKNIVPDLEEELFRWAFESACTVFFDKRLGILDKHSPKVHKEINQFVYSFQNILSSSATLMLKPYNIQKMLKTKHYKIHKESWDLLFRVSRDLIDDKLNELAEKVAKSDKEQVDDGSFLSYLVSQDKLTDEEIYGNMTELLAAAVDTTSNSILWTLYCLAKNLECQECLYEEVMRVLPEGVTPTKEHYNEMKYLKAVMQETQRLFPIVGGVGRQLSEDTEIDGYKIPAGMSVILDTYSVSRNPEYFEDPLSFKPERWLSRVKGESLNNFLMLPFGVGVRSCIGRRLAEQEMHLLLPKIVRNFRVEIDKEISAVSRILLVPDQPLDLRLINRK